MRFLYNVNIFLLGLGISLGRIFSKKARLWVNGRKQWPEKLSGSLNGPVDLWMHCASLGEFDQGLPVLWAYREKYPTAQILVTFFSPSGFQNYHKRAHCADHVAYLPLDTPKNAKLFLDLVKPKSVVFVKYEFWLNFLFQIRKAQIACYSISTLLRPQQVYFKWYGGLFRNGLKCIQHFYVQDQKTHDLLQQIGISKVQVTGDTRYDTVWMNRELNQKQANTNPLILELEQCCENKTTLILGSSWLVEEELLHEAISSLSFDLYLVAPHNVEDKHIYELEAMFGDQCIRLSEIRAYANEKVIIIDSIGLLNQVYQFGDIAFVGGGFTGKLHNILEPAVYGLPVLFGPRFAKFPEAAAFIHEGLAYVVKNADDLVQIHKQTLSKKEALKKNMAVYFKSKMGATDKIMAHLDQ